MNRKEVCTNMSEISHFGGGGLEGCPKNSKTKDARLSWKELKRDKKKKEHGKVVQRHLKEKRTVSTLAELTLALLKIL